MADRKLSYREAFAQVIRPGLHNKGKAKSHGKHAGKRGQEGAEAGLRSGRRDLFGAQLSLGEPLE